MPTNPEIPDYLVAEGQRVGSHKSKRAAVTAALEVDMWHHEQLRIVELAGRIDYEEGASDCYERARA